MRMLRMMMCVAALSAIASAQAVAEGLDFSQGGAFSFDSNQGTAFSAIKDSALSLTTIRANSSTPLSFLVVAYKDAPQTGWGSQDLWFNVSDTTGNHGGVYDSAGDVVSSSDDIAWTETVTLNGDKDSVITKNSFTAGQYGVVYIYNPDTGKLYTGSAGTGIGSLASEEGIDPNVQGLLAYYDQSNKQGERYDPSIFVVGSSPVTPSGSSGAPLPGVLATLVVCGAVGGYLKRRKALSGNQQ